MAEVAALELQIGAKMDQALRGLKKFDKSLDQLKGDLKTFKIAQETTFDPKQFAAYQRKIDQISGEIETRFKGIGVASKQASRAMSTMSKSSGNAQNSLFALSGVVQDAPYGIRGMANNVTFLSQQMAYSAKASGGFGKALKEMGSAFLGPAGIIFGISAAVSLIDYFSNRTNKAAKETDKLKDEIASLGEGIGSAIANTQKEATQLNILYRAATNAANGTDLQRKAAEKLKKLKPELFKQYSTEQIMLGAASRAYNAYSKQILQAARAQGAFNSIVKNSEARAKIFGQVLDLSNELSESAAANKAQIANFNGIFERLLPESQITALGGRIAVINEFLRQPAKVNAAIQKGLISKQDVQNLIGLSDALSEVGVKERKNNAAITKLVEKYTKLGDVSAKIKDTINVSNLIDSIKDPGTKTVLDKMKDDVDNLTKKLPVLTTQLRTLQYLSIAKGGNATDAFGGTQGLGQAQLGGGPFQTLNTQTPQTQKALDAIQQKMGDIAKVGQLIDGTFESVFSTIASGGNAFDALKQAIQQVIIKLTAAVATAALLNFLTGGTFGAASAAAGGISGPLAGLEGLLGLASGGIAYGPTPALIGEYAGARSNPEVVAPLDKLQEYFRAGAAEREVKVTGVLVGQGTSVKAVIDNTKNKFDRIN